MSIKWKQIFKKLTLSPNMRQDMQRIAIDLFFAFYTAFVYHLKTYKVIPLRYGDCEEILILEASTSVSNV